MIIEYAKSLGFSPPKKVKLQEWTHYAQDRFPVEKWVWRELKPSDIKVSRANTTQGKDLGEYWVSYAQSLTTFRVTDEDLKSFIRDKKIKSILKS